MKTELKVLFFSPIAWLILIVFAFQVGMDYSTIFSERFLHQEIGYAARSATAELYGGYGGLMVKLLGYLYLYIPLLTMGLMSRELSSGSIKLLYSSPVSNFQIIMGKYFTTLVYGLILCVMFTIPFIHTYLQVKDADVWLMLTAMLGVYLTIAAYAAIGLFMSTVTKYQVVAVVGTLAILAILNFIGDVGQEYDFVRDITYWLSIKGRSKEFIYGMICTRDVLYFVLVIFMFLGLSIVKLQGERLKLSKWNTFLRYAGVVVFAVLLGYISSRPKLIKYLDVTTMKSNTLTIESQEILSQLEGDMTITTYINIFDNDYWKGAPRNRISDMAKFEKYVRFKPEIKMKYVYYYDWVEPSRILDDYRDSLMTIDEIYKNYCEKGYAEITNCLSPTEVNKLDDIAEEKGAFVRVISSANGKKAKLRIYKDSSVDPFEPQITTALKTMIVDETPYVGFTTGHKERGCLDYGEKGYGYFSSNNGFRYSLVNSGFRVKEVSLDELIPADVNILVLADIRSEITEEQHKNLDEYIERGGNLFILGEPKRQELMNPVLSKLGLRFSDGILVVPTNLNLDDIIPSFILPDGGSKVTPRLGMYGNAGYCIMTPSACAVQLIDTTKGYNVEAVLATPMQGSWIEKETTDFINEKSTLNPEMGEVEESNAVMLYLTKNVNNKEQRIFVIGDADCISTLELSTNRTGYKSSNFSLISEVFRNLSYEEFPVEAARERDPDNLYISSTNSLVILKVLVMGIIPVALLAFAVTLLIRRKRR